MSTLFSTTPEFDEASAVYLRVAVERGIERTSRKAAPHGTAADAGALTYRAGEPVAVGERVEVPLGRGDTTAAGIVIESGGRELLEGLHPSRVKPILRRTGARLPSSLIELARWMAGYYVCPIGMVLATMMPAAVKHGTGLKRRTLIERTGAALPEGAKLTPAVKTTWAAIQTLEAGVWPLPPRELVVSAGAASMGPINRLIKLGLLRTVQREEVAAATGMWEGKRIEQGNARPRPELTPDQRHVAEGIKATIGSFAAHLIRGVTGSGKTEVYLSVLESALARDPEAGAIVLVPEISLTPQTAGRFVERFGRVTGAAGSAGVAVLHSGLTSAQRHKQWAAVSSGEARVVVGARSAIFAPMKKIGLIVVDEEHDSSYKQDQLPRYSGRDAAVKRAQLEGCPVVLGTATPSLESWHNALGGRYTLWELEQRVGGGRLPRVELIDVMEERTQLGKAARGPDGAWRLIGPTLALALRRTLEQGGQAILLLNRRGFANYICCPSDTCGWVMHCGSCDATMIYHKAALASGGYLRCHHCLAEQRMPRECPDCGKKVLTLGAGTQRLEAELTRDFALAEGVGFLRIDSDTMRTASDYFDALSRFASGEVQVLMGTQMIAKGLDFPNVRLVGVVDADTALSLPDFRSAERTFQLVSQVAGRAGRGEHAGRVVVQTMNPHVPAIRHAAAHDFRSFATEELAVRTKAGLPPATRMARVVSRDEDHAKATAAATAIANALRHEAERLGREANAKIEGPADCPISRIAGQHRVGVEVYASGRGAIQAMLTACRSAGLLKSDASTAVDVDPIALM